MKDNAGKTIEEYKQPLKGMSIPDVWKFLSAMKELSKYGMFVDIDVSKFPLSYYNLSGKYYIATRCLSSHM